MQSPIITFHFLSKEGYFTVILWSVYTGVQCYKSITETLQDMDPFWTWAGLGSGEGACRVEFQRQLPLLLRFLFWSSSRGSPRGVGNESIAHGLLRW